MTETEIMIEDVTIESGQEYDIPETDLEDILREVEKPFDNLPEVIPTVNDNKIREESQKEFMKVNHGEKINNISDKPHIDSMKVTLETRTKAICMRSLNDEIRELENEIELEESRMNFETIRKRI